LRPPNPSHRFRRLQAPLDESLGRVRWIVSDTSKSSSAFPSRER
jgi:hypothetical protein